ncbi:rapamycin-insensitive companion of mTOR [Anabrus simplex]|uniref:rapamycin-insensitive companion of mTOR n=1 Tax=Anabrus simplex TaxID=316456 RepID=UPI0035A3D649
MATMASWMIRGRSLRPGRSIRSRHDSEDDVQIDFSKGATENAREILINVCKKHGLSEGKRFNYLNALVKLITKSDVGAGELGFTVEEIQCCLRVALVHEASQVRAAALRAVRYLLKEESDVKTMNSLRYSVLIARSLDINLRNEMERVQALRLVRRMLVLAPAEFPPSLMRSLVSLANGAAEEKDRMLRACLATLAEICVLNSEVFMLCGGVSAISRNILDCQMPRIAESLCGVLLFLLNSPATRSRAAVHLQALAAPYCDFHWDSTRHREEREVRFHCSRLALLSVLRSWPGVLHFCHPANNSGLRSLVDILYVKQLEVRKAVLDLLYDLLGLPQPQWTDEFSVALEAVDPSYPRDAWKLSEGFVAAEGRAILPHLAKNRPNLVEIHLALLLYTFLEVGLLEAIVEVVVTSDTFISVRATILLGELLQLVHVLLPSECCNLTPCLPNLLAQASIAADANMRQQALASVAALADLHQMLKRRPAPASLFLDQLLQMGGWGRTGIEEPAGSKLKREKSKLYQLLLKDSDDILRESAVLTNKDGFSWNWNVVRAVLKSSSDSLKKLEDSNHRTFLRRLVHYFKPSNNRFSRVELGNKRQTHMYTLAGCELLDCLLDSDEPEAAKLLTELLADIWVQLEAITSSKSAHDCLFSPQHVSNSLCQDYFLFIGRLCRTSRGMRVLDKAGILQQLLNLVVSTNHECYVKLVVSSLDYSIDGMPRVILGKVLTAPSEASRLYATQFLLVLLRARLPDFSKWGIELLVNQLYDQSRTVSLAAISILSEAAEEKAYLDAVVSLRPSLLHLGDKGLLLLIRFLSTSTGFTFLHDANFVTNQLDRWATSYNYRYVRLVEGELHDSLTLHQRGEDGHYSRRVTSAKHCVRDVYVPPHLYGQLVQHERGMQLLVREGRLSPLFQCVHLQRCSTEQEILELKAALWACGHIGTSPAGVTLLAEEGVFSAVTRVAESSPVYSLRGTAFYVLGLLATTFQGANELAKTGWLCVRHNRHERWPVIEPEVEVVAAEGDRNSLSSGAAGWDLEPGGAHHSNFYLEGDEDESLASGDEGMMLEESTSSARWTYFTDISRQRKPSYGSSVQQRKSQTLPHWHSPRGGLVVPPRHIRSLSESKQSSGDWSLEPSAETAPVHRGRELQHLPSIAPRADETKSRSNSCTDSSGVSSCDSGLGKHTTSERIQTLSPIPSSTSLNTLKSAGINRRSSMSSGRKHSMQGSITSEGTPSSPDTRISQQDLLGYATLRSLHRYRRPVYSDSSSLAAEELLGFDDPCAGVSARAIERNSERQHQNPMLCEFEAPIPPQLLSGGSSASLAARTYYGSRSNIGGQQGIPRESELTQQCYMGICLPRQLGAVFPQDGQSDPQVQTTPNRRRGSASFSEMEQVQEVGEETETTSSSESDDPDNLLKPQATGFATDSYRHSAATCLSCCRRRDRKISTSSYHRHRTDTESSCGGGESPILYPRRRKSHSTSSCVLGATPGGSVESSNSLDMGSSQQDDAAAPSKALIRREILKHVSRMSNPVWNKVSKQALLQLKQKHASIFQDVCLYSAVCHRMDSSTYRLVARRFIQELFLDLNFDVLYEEPANILQIQQQPQPAGAAEGSNSTSLQTAIPGISVDSSNTSGGNLTGGPKSFTGAISALSMKLASSGHSPEVTVTQDTRVEDNPLPTVSSVLSSGTQISTTSALTSSTANSASHRTNISDPVPIAVAPPSCYSVRSPPLEVVKEEITTSVSSLERFSSTESISTASNELMNEEEEEEAGFLNLQFDDIPMIDETVRVNSGLRTPDSPVLESCFLHKTSKGTGVISDAVNKVLVTGTSKYPYNPAECPSNKVNLINSKPAAVAQITKTPGVAPGVSNNGVLVNNGCAEKCLQELSKLEKSLPSISVEMQKAVTVHYQENSLLLQPSNIVSGTSYCKVNHLKSGKEADSGVSSRFEKVNSLGSAPKSSQNLSEPVTHCDKCTSAVSGNTRTCICDPSTESPNPLLLNYPNSSLSRTSDSVASHLLPIDSIPQASEIKSSVNASSSKKSACVRHRKLATTAAPNISEVNVPHANKNVPATSHQLKQSR